MTVTASSTVLSHWREAIRQAPGQDEATTVHERIAQAALSAAERQRISDDAAALVVRLRASTSPGLMESLLAEYGLSDEEGLALMCLAEAYLRVPDTGTIDALIRDKIGSGHWSRHAGAARSMLVNASTWGLMVSGEVFRSPDTSAVDPGRLPTALGVIDKLKQRVGEPVVRLGVGAAMRVMGQQFVLGRTIDEAIDRSRQARKDGYRFSFDMLGEAARTDEAARRYFDAYVKAIKALAGRADPAADVFDNPGISVKLSALHPRYESVQAERLMLELVPRVTELARMAAKANIGFNIDAEEANRLDISLDVIEAVFRDEELRGWDGFGIVVQAYAKSCLPVLNWFHALAASLQSRVAVRLVKGAYWDMEIKQAQTLGLQTFPVFTRKSSTDVSYLAGARFLLDHADWIYPQFASHNAHTIAAVVVMAEQQATQMARFEFQRLHGMGESLHAQVLERTGRICRIYAPVGEHEDLLAYLVRRMLENGANSSFVNQLMDERIAPARLVADPIDVAVSVPGIVNPKIPLPIDLYQPARLNSRGWDVNDAADQRMLAAAIEPFVQTRWQAAPAIGSIDLSAWLETPQAVCNPANPADTVGTVVALTADGAAAMLACAQAAQPAWAAVTFAQRAAVLEQIADGYEQHAGELLALLIREAGKNRVDAIAEVREAVDFCRYYAQQARDGLDDSAAVATGVQVCISPWNFPLAILTGQIVAALVAGNAVIAKPADQTPLIAARADVLGLAPGSGRTIGAALTASPAIAGVCFTGSTATAQQIDRSLAAGNPQATLVAETGGINAMIVDSTALLEASVRDIVQSAFQSAGQRCSALRVLFVQDDIADELIAMLAGATAELCLGDPLHPAVDVGPLIDAQAHARIADYCARRSAEGRRLFGGESVSELLASGRMRLRGAASADAAPEFARLMLAPVAFEMKSFADIDTEIFGPVLHVVRFAAKRLDEVIGQINDSGYGLTFGLQSRIDNRVRDVCYRIRAGNAYVNRNQIGAVVGVQPFGGEGLSGTGPKAGGPHYLDAFLRDSGETLPRLKRAELPKQQTTLVDTPDPAELCQRLFEQAHRPGAPARLAALQAQLQQLPAGWRPMAAKWLGEAGVLFDETLLQGPTGETNRLRSVPRGPMLCMGDGATEVPADETLVPLTVLCGQALKVLVTGNPILLSGPMRHLAASLLLPMLRAAGLPTDWLSTVEPAAAMALVAGDRPGALKLSGVVIENQSPNWGTVRSLLAGRDGARVPLLRTSSGLHRFALERVITIDTTASGGNASLLSLEMSASNDDSDAGGGSKR